MHQWVNVENESERRTKTQFVKSDEGRRENEGVRSGERCNILVTK